MHRKPRIEYPGAFYHVVARGNQKQRIFKDQADFRKFLLLLTVYKNRTGCRIFAYVLMNNHVHLLIETKEVHLSKFMQGLNQTYTMYFNRRYRTVGHLFQGRYKAILCDRDAYLLGLLKYIHHNPVRAKITKRPDQYPWSSHLAYSGKDSPLGIVDTDLVLYMFSENKTRARRKYREFMEEEEALSKAAVYATIDQRLQGDESFVDEVQKLTEMNMPAHRQNVGVNFHASRSPVTITVATNAANTIGILSTMPQQINRALRAAMTDATVLLLREAQTYPPPPGSYPGDSQRSCAGIQSQIHDSERTNGSAYNQNSI